MKQNISIHKAIPNTGALDFSHLLDAPAGKHGLVESRDGHLYFEDGGRARFFGFNVATRSNTPDHATADKLAERFASMGVNIIRLHAADAPVGEEPCSWTSCKEAPLLNQKQDGPLFNAEGLDRFDYFAAKLKEKGIYLHIDLLVARGFEEEDDVDAPFPSCCKRYAMYNAKLIERQKEYAKELLTHVNPYTGLSLADDPAVVTVQINNEESAIKGTADNAYYAAEVQNRFNHFLLMKYGSREELAKAWTYEGQCALEDGEDPTLGTVKEVSGDFYQPVCEPMGDWEKVPRYADFMEFGMQINRQFYSDMKNYLRSLGVRVPIVTSNLLAGAADVYGHTGGDLMENNSYFNHPILPQTAPDTYLVAGPTEYVSVNPLTVQTGVGAMATTLLSLASVAIVNGKPFLLSEWNEYGLHPFHSTALVHTVAYACLNDWDGLILYNHHTSENWDDQPADEIRNVFDTYNDPAVICQWGFAAEVFLKGLISPAKHLVDVVYTKNDLDTLPNFHAMPDCFFPYITSLRNVFIDQGDSYSGSADLAVTAGFTSGADLRSAKHAVCYAWSPYRDAFRKHKDEAYLKSAVKGTQEIAPGVHLGESSLVFDQISEVAGSGDYRQFAAYMDSAMKSWGILGENTGFIDGKLISDTGEICFDPDHARFAVRNENCGYFSGAPTEEIVLSDRVKVHSENERISLSLLPTGENEYLLTAMGATGMSETTQAPGLEFAPGISLTVVHFAGKLYAETLEGSITVKADKATLEALDVYGNLIEEIPGTVTENGIQFSLTGELSAVNFLLKTEKSK